MPTLAVHLPHGATVIYRLEGERVTIGRRPENTIEIPNCSVSAHHAELRLVDGHYRLHDLGSTNLTFVDDVAVEDFHLHAACAVKFGLVSCAFDPAGKVPAGELSREELERDVTFLREQNFDLLSKIQHLERQIDIVATARLVMGKDGLRAEDVARLRDERDAALRENAELRRELEKSRGEVFQSVRDSKRATQCIIFPVAAARA